MRTRTAGALFSLSLALSLTATLLIYLQFQHEVSNLPEKYKSLDAEYNQQVAEYNKEQAEVNEYNSVIYRKILTDFLADGGRESDLSRFDQFRFMTGGTTSNKLFNEIARNYEDQKTNSLTLPKSINHALLMRQDSDELRGFMFFRFKVIGLIQAIVTAFLIFLILVPKRTKQSPQ